MDDERDAEDAIRKLDRTVFGRKERRLRVEWTKVSLVIISGALPDHGSFVYCLQQLLHISRHVLGQVLEQDFLLIFHF